MQQVRRKLDMYPAVAILGPRQCGKTTLARGLGGRYFDMESAGDQAKLDVQWHSLIDGDQLVVLDEAQQAPDVFSRLRGAIDADRKRNGRFLLLGSVSMALMKNVSQSLAGRIGMVELTPFTLSELGADRLDDLWLRGGYPDGGITDARMFPQWQKDYLATLVAHDLPLWGLAAHPQQTMRLLSMLAVLHGQPLNASQLGASLAVDYKTILNRCDYLDGAFLIRRLQPYLSNLRKRLVRTPRLYWRDSGLVHALMNVADLDTLYRQPWLGQSWEGFVIEQTLATLGGLGKSAQPCFMRTSDGYELDLVLDWGVERWAIEIKLTSDPSPGIIERLNKAANLIDADRRILICRVNEPFENDKMTVTNLSAWMTMLAS